MSNSEFAAQPAPASRMQDVAGDAASPAALGRLTRTLARADRSPKLKAQRKGVAHLKAAVLAIQARDYANGSARALEALKFDEANGLAWHILAIAQEKGGHFEQALQAYDAALRLLPDETDIAGDLGRLAQRLGYLEIAEKLYAKGLARSPGNVEATNNLACVQRDQGRYSEAIDTLRSLLAVTPETPLLWNTLGTVLSEQGEMAGSVVFFDEALRLDPGFSKALYNRANVRQALGDSVQALIDIDLALDQVEEPVEIDTIRMAKALTQIFLGDLANGFETYEVRFSPNLESAVQFVTNAPLWDPQDDVAGMRMLVFGEQGLGDEVMFASLLPDLLQAVGPEGHLTVAVERRMVPLYQRSFPDARIVAHQSVKLGGRVTRRAVLPADEPAFDRWVPVASLYRRFRKSAAEFPGKIGFMQPDPARVAHWTAVLRAESDLPKVGVLWKSLRMEGSRRRYFSPFELWAPVLATPGATFVNLQYGDIEEELAQAAEAGLRLWTPPGINLKDDLDDVAALTATLDLVLGQPNATTNIAAAVGTPWWGLASPDDWTLFGTDTYPTFPNARAFISDGFGAWEGVMQRLAASLAEWTAERARGNAA